MAERSSPAARVVGVQVRQHTRSFWRNPLGAFFTAVFPVLLLVIFGGLFGDEQIVLGERWVPEGQTLPGAVPFGQVITPAIAAFAIAMAGYVQLATATAAERADGTLKRLRGTPLPPWAYLTGRVLSATLIATLSAGLVVSLGALITDMEIAWRGVPAAVLLLLVGSAAFAALGLMLVALVRPGSVQAVAFGTLLPLAFISEIFIHGTMLPALLDDIAWTFPLRHLAVGLRDALAADTGPVLEWVRVAVLAAWGLAGALIAGARFSWDPTRPRGRS